MTTKLLQLAGAAHGGFKRLTNIFDAVNLLGVDSIRNLVPMPGIFEQADKSELPEGFELSRLWEHALKVCEYSKCIIACDTDDTEILDAAYTAGLLHDIGFLIVSTRMSQSFAEAIA